MPGPDDLAQLLVAARQVAQLVLVAERVRIGQVLLDSLDRQDALIERGAVRDLDLPVSVIFGERDRYLNPALAAEIAGLFSDASLHVLPGATHYPQHDQPDVVAELLKRAPA